LFFADRVPAVVNVPEVLNGIEGQAFKKTHNDPEKRKTYEMLTQAINDARDRGDIDLLNTIASNPEAFILKQGWKAVSLDDSNGPEELHALYEHLQVSILEVIEALDNLKASQDYELYERADEDPSVIADIIADQRAAVLIEIKSLQEEADRYEEETRELHGSVPF
jgi:hypothetical protein